MKYVRNEVKDKPFPNCKFDEPQSKTPVGSASTNIEFRAYLLLSVKSAVPGCALKLSAAPPTTIVIAEPFPFRRILSHERFDTEHTPIESKISR